MQESFKDCLWKALFMHNVSHNVGYYVLLRTAHHGHGLLEGTFDLP
jgi:hypothetical protein